MSAVEVYSFERPLRGRSPVLRVLSPTELRDCVAFAGSYDTFYAALTAEKHPDNTYLQINRLEDEGVIIRGYHQLLRPEVHQWRRRARARLNLPI